MSTTHDGSHAVLVVEDDDTTREMFALFLSQDGYAVETAANGRVALERLRAGCRPSVIVLDLMMPEMDGWAFRAEQRRDKALPDVPVIVVSAAGDLPHKTARLGASACLAKPVDPDELIQTVRRFCV